jgi:hypothetical protein
MSLTIFILPSINQSINFQSTQNSLYLLQCRYSINTVLAVQAFFSAKAKNLPAAFWAAKTFVLGGVAYYEVKQATDPTKPASALEDKSYLSDRKSQNRDSTQFKR